MEAKYKITPEIFRTTDILSYCEGAISFYPEQQIPIYTDYAANENFKPLIVDFDRLLLERCNGYKVKLTKGAKIWLRIGSPANGDPHSANSFKVVIEHPNEDRDTYVPLLNFIPDTCEGGTLKEFNKHYDSILQIKNFHSIVFGKHETAVECSERELKIIENYIPEHDFFVGKPYNSREGFDVQKVLFKDGKYLRLRGEKWITLKELNKHSKGYKTEEDAYQFNVWGEYDNKYDMAWHVLHNACLILKSKKQATSDEWSKQFDKYEAEVIKTYDKTKYL